MNEIKVLDKGFVRLIDHMGDDSAIVQAARVSYGKGTKTISEDKGLIRYLVRHKHTSPLEMVDFKFHMKMPIFVARQVIRHRTTSVNEVSLRYSEAIDEFYVPEEFALQPQSKNNKQGREGNLQKDDIYNILNIIESNNENTFDLYKVLLGEKNSNDSMIDDFSENYQGIARELARMVLPVNLYTEWYWKINLHNLFHFLKLRLDSHAQYEIRCFAEAIYNLIKPIVPIACEAFEDYILYANNFSRAEINFIRELMYSLDLQSNSEEIIDLLNKYSLSKREKQEFLDKLFVNQ